MNPNTFLRSTLKNNKPFFITTPIFYVNARPHVGHLYTLLLVDAIARYNKLKSNVSVISTTGTDEHGMKIQKAALAAGMKPLEFCSQNSQHFANLAVKANTDFTHFIRTTNKHHVYAVHNFWERLVASGCVYTSQHSGWYAINDECFYPASSVTRMIKNASKASVNENGTECEWTQEKNYHFRLSHWTQTLLRHYHQHPDFVQPAVYYDAVVAELERGLKNLSISRPTSRIPWGILTPGDPTQTVYVWLDALVNYVSAIGYPWQSQLMEQTSGWPADVHVIGKDIVRFHCIYWPAFLLAAGLKLPKHILVHGHWTMKDMKMSKSRGNVVDPFQLLERYGVDSVRYYLLKHGRLANDANFDENGIQSTLDRDLKRQLGNLLSRMQSEKISNINPEITKLNSGDLLKHPDIQSVHSDLQSLPHQIDVAFSKGRVYDVLTLIMNNIEQANRLLQTIKPWSPDTDASLRTCTINLVAQLLRMCGIFLQPVIPQKAEELLDRLHVPKDKRTLVHACVSDAHATINLKKTHDGHLF